MSDKRKGVFTFNDLSGDNNKKKQTYAGGQSSGLAIEHPGRGNGPAQNPDPEQQWNKLMENARSFGAVEADEAKRQERERVGMGAGYRLGSDANTDSKPLPGTVSNERTVFINYWEDGFSIDDGPLRTFDDVANRQFIEDINNGKVPPEIDMPAQPGQPRPFININLVQKGCKYTPPAKESKPFEGSGKSLSGSTSTTTHVARSAAPPGPCQMPEVVDSKPATTLQIRLADGTRMKARFNTDHTIGDIRGFINSSSPGQANNNYDIITTMPRQVFSDDSQTIEAAGLKQACVVQHMK